MPKSAIQWKRRALIVRRDFGGLFSERKGLAGGHFGICRRQDVGWREYQLIHLHTGYCIVTRPSIRNCKEIAEMLFQDMDWSFETVSRADAQRIHHQLFKVLKKEKNA